MEFFKFLKMSNILINFDIIWYKFTVFNMLELYTLINNTNFFVSWI